MLKINISKKILYNKCCTGQFEKKYIALLEGTLDSLAGTINVPIARKSNSIIERIPSNTGHSAITHYKVLENKAQYSLVEFKLETGRTHQLRVHSKYIGHPILGDSLYGEETPLIKRQALHAYRICFYHPISKNKVIYFAEIPNDIKGLISYPL